MTFKKPTFYFKSFLASLISLFVFSLLAANASAATFTFGTTSVGASTDSGNGNSITCNRYAAGSSGTLSSLSVRVGNVDSVATAYSLAIYANSSSNAPTTLLGSATGTLTANAWNTVAVSAPIVAGNNYWLCYNSKTTKSAYNNIKYASGSTPAIYKAQKYGTWPSTFGTVDASWTSAYSVYATVILAATPTATPTPTKTPTPSPTKQPTPTPTKAPTPTPTSVPTATPTIAPTATPTPQPSTAPTNITSGGTYTLVNQCGGMVASVPNSSTDDAAVLQTAVPDGGTNQQWVITNVGDGYYKLLNKNSDKAMDVVFGATTDLALAIQYPYNGAASQQWKIVNYGTYYKLYAKHSNKALDVWFGSSAAGINLQQYSENNSCAQQWKIEAIPTPEPVCSTPAPTNAEGYQSLIRGPINDKWYHGDYGGSVMLPNGKTLWVFGDTIIGDAGAERGNAAIHNSAILVDKGCSYIMTNKNAEGKDTEWVTPPASMDVPDKDDYYWLNTPFMDGSTLRAFLGHLYNDADGFHPIGADLATYTIENGVPKLESVVETPGSASYGTTPVWGGGVISSDGYNYIFGSLSKNEPLVFGHYYYVARVPVGETTSKSAWEFWNGSAWVTTQADAAPIINGVAGLAAGITVYKNAAGEFVIISKKGDSFGTDLIAWKATTITGPWTEVTPPLMAPIPVPNYTTQDYTYLGLGHPEITLPSGNLLVSWSLGSNDASFFGDSRYGVYFGEVTQP